MIPCIDRDVWDKKNEIAKDEQISDRVLEIAIRTALVCAAFDGMPVLHACDLNHAWEMARYQKRLRAMLVPNPGRNQEAQMALKLLGYLDTYSVNGNHLKLRDTLRAIHAYEYGPRHAARDPRLRVRPALCERVLGALEFSGEIEQCKVKNYQGKDVRVVRRIREGDL